MAERTAPGARRLLAVFGPFVGLALVLALFGSLEPERFLSAYNLKTVLVQTTTTAICALGMTLVIICGGIDLSVGSSIALSTVVVAHALKRGAGAAEAAALGILTGGAFGLVNGATTTLLRIPPFIATLGTLMVGRGLAKQLAGEQKIDAPAEGLTFLMSKASPSAWAGLAPGAWIMLALACATAILLRRTVLGVHATAIGSNEATARLCGVAVARTRVVVYAISGILTGVAGVLYFSRLTVGDPTAALGEELPVVAAVVIGGASLSGGEASVLGSVVGAFVMSFLSNGCTLVGAPNYVQEIIIGAVIIAAVALDRLRRAVRA